jgi:hypothetical protein
MQYATTTRGRGRLITPDGSCRNGRYDLEVRDDAGLLSGNFEIDKGDVRPGDDDYVGAATLQLEDGREADVVLGGISDNLVVLRDLSLPLGSVA